MSQNQHNFETELANAARAIQESDAILVTAGAGIGVDSGLPDFRGNEGFWNAYPPLKHLGLSFVEMANPAWFSENPRLAWGFYGHRMNLYRETKPHKGFEILRDIGKTKKKGIFVFTSNVDGQFQKAGFPVDRIVECHGSIHHIQCASPSTCASYASNKMWPATDVNVKVDPETFLADPKTIPACPAACGSIARPNILMFGDWDWIPTRTNEQQARYENWLHEVKSTRSKLVVIDIGAGTAVPTARHAAESVVREYNKSAAQQAPGGQLDEPIATLIRINVREAQIPDSVSSPTSGAGATSWWSWHNNTTSGVRTAMPEWKRGTAGISLPMGSLLALTEIQKRIPSAH